MYTLENYLNTSAEDAKTSLKGLLASNPDPAAPEISFNVQSIQTREEIGVFEDEWVFLHEELPEELKC
ncbi:hypothetical protein ACSN2V_004669 [Vibrio parahaemolyticus]